MNTSDPLTSQPQGDPAQRIAELERQLQQRDASIAVLQVEVSHLQELVRQLREQLDEANRKGKRQATPFARAKRVERPKRPGRKKGQGRFSYRRPPAPPQVHETKVTPLEGCPACGGPVSARKQHEQYVVDIPPVEPVITRYVTESGYCAHCRKRVRSRHPEQISAATGAAGRDYP